MEMIRHLIRILAAVILGSLYLLIIPANAAPGDLDPTFGNGGTATDFIDNVAIRKVLLQPDGKIIVVGSRKISIVFGQPPLDYLFVRRYTSTGAVDASYPALKRGIGYDAEIQPDGKLVVIGNAPNTVSSPFGTYNVSSPVVWRFNSNATTDTGFGSNGARFINVAEGGNFHIELFAGNIFIAYAGRTVYLFTTSYRVSRISADGAVNLTVSLPFTYLADEKAFSMKVDTANGDFVVGGPRSSDQNTVLRRYTQNGDVITAFGTGGEASVPDCITWYPETRVKDLVIQSNGRILVHRYADESYTAVNVSRQDSNGAADGLCIAFEIWPYVDTDLFLQPDGRFFFYTGINASYRRYFPDGTPATNIYPALSTAGAIQPDQKLVTAGAYPDPISLRRQLLD